MTQITDGEFSPPDNAEVPLPLREPFLRALVHDFPLGVVLFDTDGQFLFVNEATAEINGLPVTDHVGRHIREVVPDLWEDARPILERVRNGEIVEWEISGETPAMPGLTRQWAEQWFPVCDAAGAVVAVAGTLLEITEQKRAEETLRRTAATRERLMHLASHEIRSPLTSILGFAQRLVRRSDLDAEVREGLEIIVEQAAQIRQRLDLFLALSDEAADVSDASMPLAPVELRALIESELQTAGVRHQHTRFNFIPEHPDLTIETAAGPVRQVLANLLDNAGKYGGEGPVTVHARRQDEGGLEIEVRDEGPGIAAELQARIFEQGFRTEEARRRGVDGDGLGLHVAQRLAMRLGGSLSVHSIAGDGASFFLRLPQPPTATGGSS